MFKFKLSDGSELTLSINFAAKTIEITQRPGTTEPGVTAKLQIPLADVKAIVKQFKDLKDYFA